MNIKILDSWLREYLKTNATPKQIAEKLSLSSVSVERLEAYKQDFLYDIEVTTNRPDLMSVVGLAREAATVLTHNNISATFLPPKIITPKITAETASIAIKNDPKLVNRICAVVMEVSVKKSPKDVVERLETTGMRSLNNLIDITNYVTRTIGHTTHVFDFDRLATKKLIIRESKKGEQVVTLDKKIHILTGGDIVAENDQGKIVDLLGIMGLENSVVTNQTKRILFFLDNNEPTRMRKTSMSLGIRTEAAILNEKETDPELAWDAFLYGISLFQKLADGKIISPLIDIYPNKGNKTTVIVSEQQINAVIGISIPLTTSVEILESLGFETKREGSILSVTPPSFRAQDFTIPEDVIEEIARVYGYENIPNALPTFATADHLHLEKNEFYWEDRVKDALKYWGFTEVYTYPMISKALFEGPIHDAVTIQNPLSDDMVYMRKTLIPSLLQVAQENQDHEIIKLFELANIYEKNGKDLPAQTLTLAGLIHKPNALFAETKGVVDQLLHDVGIEEIIFKQRTDRYGAAIFLSSIDEKNENKLLGNIEILDERTITFELNFGIILQHARMKKIFKQISKYPPIMEDLAIVASINIATGDLMETIKKQNSLIQEVSLLDKYQDTRTFHIVYQSSDKNLNDKEVGEIRTKILQTLKAKYNARLKG